MAGNTESLDIFNGTGQHIGEKPRDIVHTEGLWHRSIHCWVIYNDSKGAPRVVLQKRADTKTSWPGYFDITAAGHLTAGESVEDGLREIEEEIGITPSYDKLIDVGTRVCVEDFKVGTINREFQFVFFLIDDRPLTEYTIDLQELAGLVCPKIDDLITLFRGETDMVEADGIRSRTSQSSMENVAFTITREQFIPTLDQYNYKAMVLAKRALLGEKDLLI